MSSFPPTPSFASAAYGIMPNRLRVFAQRAKPEISITLNDVQASSVPTYSSLDRIEGTATIRALHDTPFDNIDIEFIGASGTFVERYTSTVASQGRSEAFHQFLKLAQPIEDSALPANRILEADRKYTFPFLFVVPQQMLPRICRHKIDNENVHEAHIQLPPTIGLQDVTAKPTDLPDDFCPDMAHIRYHINVKVAETAEEGQKVQPTVQTKMVRILPASAESPPVDIDGPGSEYVLRAVKTVRKGLLKGKLGSLVAEVAQPKSVRLPAPTAECQASVSTMATVMLRFDPAENVSQPPRLSSLNSKLKVNTYYASAARPNIPNKDIIRWDLHQGLHTESVSLSSRCVAGVEWTFHASSEPEALVRRDSGFSISSLGNHPTPKPSEKFLGNGFYTAKILVPITLPSNKTFVPTFHSCLISRVYSVSLNLGINSAGVSPNIELKIPLQVSSDGNRDTAVQRSASLTIEEQAQEAREADEFFGASSSSPPYEALASGGRPAGLAPAYDLPPQYEAFPRPSAARVPVVG